MQNIDFRKLLLTLLLLCAASAASVFGQVVSSGLTGVVRDQSGKTIGGATVTAVHLPTGTSYTAATNENGRFNASGMVVGGPYTVTANADGYRQSERTEITTQLGGTVDANLVLESTSGVVTMEKVTVQGSANDLDSSATGAGAVYTSGNINTVASVQRSFADVVRNNPFVSLRATLASRAQPVISAVGQNNRFNSVQVDGARINDQFGLNASGLQSFGNPISLDTIEQMSVAISPYDTPNSGFTGASINAVTKSGTNQFKGSAYYYYTNDDFQGPNVAGSAIGSRAPLLQKTFGFTFGGPIWKNRLFFFANFEKFDSLTSDTATMDPTATAQGTSDLARVYARFSAINTATGKTFNFGKFSGRTAQLQQMDEKKLLKLDWNILANQRFSVRYTNIEGELPQAGKFSQTTTLNPLSTGGGFTVNTANIAGLDSNGYNQVRKEETWAAQLFSRWTRDFKTELQYSQNEYSQVTPINSVLPEIRIFGFSGLNKTGATVNGNGALVFGTEQNRQGNFAGVDTKSYRAQGEYLWGRFRITGGFDREESAFVNLFRSGSYGLYDFANVTDFENDAPRNFLRSIYLIGTPSDEKSEFAVNGLYGQANWDVTSRLNLMLGLRYDWFTAGARPPLNAASNPQASTDFVSVFGFRNDGSIDGSNAISPRLSFNLALDDERQTQMRGGIGHFVGRIPWVIVSNSYGNSGVGRSVISNTSTPSVLPPLVTYLRGPTDPNNPQLTFDPTDPIGSSKTANVGRPNINLITDKLLPPSVWRGNFAIDRKLPALNSRLTVEAIHTRASEALFVKELNLKPRFVGSDGRQVYSGNPATQANALYPQFGNVHEMSNITKGYSTYISFTLEGATKDKWNYNAAYTLGKARDALPLGETVAASQFNRNPVFNQNVPTMARSGFEIKNRVQFRLGRDFTWWKKAKTSFSLYYEGRDGNPYSFTYANDANGDGQSNQDLVYVPNGMNDPVVVASIANGMSAAVAQQYVNFADSSVLSAYRGGVAPRYAFTMPWINRLDLHIGQEIPLYGRARLEVFADFINFGSWLSKKTFGYTETINGVGDSELFAFSNFGTATYLTSGQLVMTGTAYNAPVQPQVDNNPSRWRIQFGARLKF